MLMYSGNINLQGRIDCVNCIRESLKFYIPIPVYTSVPSTAAECALPLSGAVKEMIFRNADSKVKPRHLLDMGKTDKILNSI